MKKQRISVSLPPDMLTHYKLLAEESGISISRLIYLRLRSKKKSIVFVGREQLREVQELKTLVQSLIQGKTLNDDVADSLICYSHFLEEFVALDKAQEEVIVGGGKNANKIRRSGVRRSQ